MKKYAIHEMYPYRLFDVLSFNPILDARRFLLEFQELRVKDTEDKSGYIVSLDLPGYKKDQVEVSIEDRVLVIKAENDEKKTVQSLYLGDVDADSSKATLEDGVLKVIISKNKAALPKKVQIKD